MPSSIPHSLSHIQQASQRRTRARQRREPLWRQLTRTSATAFRVLFRRKLFLAPLLALVLCLLVFRVVRKSRRNRYSRAPSEVISLAPTRIDLPKARILYSSGTVQPILASHDVDDLTTFWQKDVDRIDIPYGTRLRIVDSFNQSTDVKRSYDCRVDSCKDFIRGSLTTDLRLSTSQIVEADADAAISIPLPSPSHWRRDEVSYVTQFSMSRFDRVLSLVQTYDGPMSLAIYLTDPEDATLLRKRLENDQVLHALSRHSITLVKPSYGAAEIVTRLRYPINRLRNLAISIAPTRYVLVTDADFVPSPNFALLLSQRAATLLGPPKPTLVSKALVVSAFESKAATLPSTLHELEQSFANGTVVLTDANAGHGPSKPLMLFSRRIGSGSTAQERPTSAWSFEVAYEPQWEPYYVLHRPSHPLYDERFTDQGGDKQSHALLLNALGYQFSVLRDVWLVHPPKSLFRSDEIEWPAERLARLDAGDSNERDARHFSIAQSDKDRFRYFEHFLPEMEKRFGKNVRWPRGASAGVIRSTMGRAKGRAVFGL